MADYTFYTVPMSRGQIARWALHEAGADYEHVLVEWANRPEGLTAANPMNKVPTVVHHTATGDHVITECAAICAYLAAAHPEADLLPRADELADYYRWLFFAAGPLEQAIIARMMAWEVTPERRGMVGYGSYDLAIGALEGLLESRDWVCGTRFTMADVYVGSQVEWGLNFGSMPDRPAFVRYAKRFRARPKFLESKDIDRQLIKAAQSV